MCGLAGFQGRLSLDLLKRMSLVQRHRGPNSEGEFFDAANQIGLAHRRLSILDLAPTGSQPMTDPSGRYTIVFNGEIYNFRELRSDLQTYGVVFRGTSDTEVLINLWSKFGPASLARLNGIFAMAIWDSLNHVLHLARDGMGVKPLYYACDSNGFRFASEIKSILQDPNVSREIDVDAIREYLSYVYCPWPRTILKAVRKLGPGERLEVKNGRITKQETFYNLPVDQPIEQMSFAEAADKVRNSLRSAVHRQMVADVPVGCFLSGGLDSSAVVAFARECQASNSLPCYTADSEESEGFTADLPYAKRVATHLNVPLNIIAIRSDIMCEFSRMLWHLDEPLADPAAANLFLICQAAREDGIKVLLGGTGGDDLFTGYRRHYSLCMERWWSWLPKPLRSLLRYGTANLPKGIPSTRRLSKLFSYADLTADERLVGYFRWATPPQVWKALSPQSVAQLSVPHGFSDSLQARLSLCPSMGAGSFRLNRMLFLEMSHFLIDHNLNYTDKLSMAVGVEARVPFLDPELVELSYRIPPQWKQRGSVGKAVLKRAMVGILPSDVIYRPKTGFGAPLRKWMLHELKPMADELLSPNVVASRGLFNPDYTSQLRELDAAGKVDVAYMLFTMMCIELWCQLYLDAAPMNTNNLKKVA
ncbi:MAG: asparagine synthase (glutamine-hydrolyzing) [Planctomycetales bacterium]|nr:asparagine synthase (glutamine-hydrolyzing) [Planctomycetales bacterium]